ncbi:uncharacterized protein LOC126408235 isoform X3 [Epinephelus moara]|uniref:uncharacterized protein LOC126408235 isoform X3 n=1 Tax=Epinephelus moara TaxID=300413 RepID=UPI00214ED20F|nr:uncharacterized protein LOC126408235 isoform X3 [Epinephelus moara]
MEQRLDALFPRDRQASSAAASVTAPALASKAATAGNDGRGGRQQVDEAKGRQKEERPAAATLCEDGTVGATGGEFELQVAMFEEVLCVAVLFIDVDPIIRSLFRRFTRPSSLLGSSKVSSPIRIPLSPPWLSPMHLSTLYPKKNGLQCRRCAPS